MSTGQSCLDHQARPFVHTFCSFLHPSTIAQRRGFKIVEFEFELSVELRNSTVTRRRVDSNLSSTLNSMKFETPRTAAVLVAEIGEAPDVPEADEKADDAEYEVHLP